MLATVLLAVVASPLPRVALANDGADPLPLDPVVVISTRSPRAVSEVVGMVSVLDDSDIEGRLATNEDGLWRYAPGIEVESSGTRFSARSVSIRGIGGNRVLMEVDGIPLQERFSVGAFADAGRSGSELDFVRRIEVLRGPASSLYGSRAIGGVVTVSTYDPEDLAPFADSWAGRIRGAYASDWDSAGASALGAWRGESAGLLLGASFRSGNEPDRSAAPDNPDRLERERTAMLAKLTLAGGATERLRLTLEGERDEAETEMNSLLGVGRFAFTTRLSGDDRTTRAGAALDGRMERGGLGYEGVVFLRETRTRQDTLDLRELAPTPARVDREFRYDTEIGGIRGRVTREFEHAGWRHRVLLGGDYTRQRREQSRDALQTRLSDGQSTNVVLGEQFPLRDFPITRSHEAALYIQDEIDAIEGHWTLIPSVRFDHTRIRVRDDELWRQANPEAELAERTVSDLSPRLGVLWRPSRQFQAWGQVAQGFRAPPAEDLNIGLDIPLFGVRALPNPDLESESSLGWELGMRLSSTGAWLSAAVFWTDYDDFIVSMVPLGPDPETGTLLFQSQNVERARIKGLELEAGAPLGLLSPRAAALTAGLSGYWARGEDRRSGERLDDVSPLSGTAFIEWASVTGEREVRLSALFARGQRPADAEAFRVPGHGILDLTGAWYATPRLTLRAGVFNLADKTWWRWGDVRRLPADDPLIPAVSAPGRSVSVSFNLGFGPG